MHAFNLILVLAGLVPSGGLSPGPEVPAAPSDKSVFVEYAEPTTSAPNWIRSTTYLTANRSASDAEYYDGLGRAAQSIALMASGDGSKDVVTPRRTDFLHRETKTYLPYPASGVPGELRPYAISEQSSWYAVSHGLTPGREYAYSEQQLEPVAGGRVLKGYLPGEAYRSHGTAYTYRSNYPQEVLRLSVSGSTLSVPGSYAAGTLTCEEMTDGDGRTSRTWTDRMGRVVCEERDLSDGGKAVVLYGYDAAGRLRCVVSPEGSALLHGGSSYAAGSQFCKRWCWFYDYDTRGRMSVRRSPGAGAEYFVYDLPGRLVMYQDGNLRENVSWKLSVYDEFGRPIQERIVSGAASATVLQSSFDAGSTPALYASSGTILREWYYDDYDSTPQSHGYNVMDGLSGVTLDSRTKGLLTGEKLNVLGTDQYVYRTYYYDNQGDVIQTVEGFPDGSLLRTGRSYDLQGNVLDEQYRYEDLHAGTGNLAVLGNSYSYDGRGRLTDASSRLSSGGDIGESGISYEYDELGRLRRVAYGGSDTPLSEQTLSYTLQGWERGRSVSDEGGDAVFSSRLLYETAPGTPSWSGQIGQWSWRHACQTEQSWRLSYDEMGRLVSSAHYSGGSPAGLYAEAVSYDRNSNILSLTRTNGTSSQETSSFTYDGNLRSAFSYDANGNVTCTNELYDPDNDEHYGAEISYNVLNLPCLVSTREDAYTEFRYLADGTKWMMVSYGGEGYLYAGPFRYYVDGGSHYLESCSVAGGRMSCLETDELGGWTAKRENQYLICDHLGSTRVIIDGSGAVTGLADYLPYGTKCSVSGQSSTETDYLWTGKEQLMSANLDTPWYDSNARLLRTDGMFVSPDPYAERHYGVSPYAYCAGDPVNLTDPDGREIVIYGTDANGNRTRLSYSAGMSYSGNDSFVSNMISYLDEIYKNGGQRALDELISSRNKYGIVNKVGRYGNNQFLPYKSGGGEVYIGASMSPTFEETLRVESLAHELFHAVQYENGQGGASITNEVEAYAFAKIIQDEYQYNMIDVRLNQASIAGDSAGNTRMGRRYQTSFADIITNVEGAKRSFQAAVDSFRDGARVNMTGTYSKFPKTLSNYKDNMLIKYYPK